MSDAKKSEVGLITALPFILFAVALAVLTMAFPIRVPITDDWLYLSQGSRDLSENPWTYFELITGHQQFLVKMLVFTVSFVPGNYVQNLTLANITIASLGLFLLAVSQLKVTKRKFGIWETSVAVLILLNLKPMYIYMSATGLGLSLAVLLIGMYYFGKNIDSQFFSRKIVLTCLFLSPFTTGLGLVIPMSHLLSVVLKIAKEKQVKKFSVDLIIGVSGVTLAYIIPTILNNLNERSGSNSVSDFNSYLNLIKSPLNSVTFLFGLIGNPMFPSSRFDPIPQIMIGMLTTFIILVAILRSNPSRLFVTITENKSPLLSGVMFLLLIISFRGEKSIDEATAPRYVIGSVLFLFGVYVYILEGNLTRTNKKEERLVFLLACILCLSLLGIKTGIEWLTVRSSQSDSLYYCISDEKNSLEKCMILGSGIREEGTSDANFLEDLRNLRRYIEQI
jgi:hypothetical protein